jgi:hypothetical protein
MEIGFELYNKAVSNITFERNLCVHQMMNVFSIHNGGHAAVSGITYRDIIVEGVIGTVIACCHRQKGFVCSRSFAFGRSLQYQPVRGVTTREECHWSHASVPRPALLKLLHACDKWHSSRAFVSLSVDTVNSVQTRKARATVKHTSALPHIPLGWPPLAFGC